MFWFWLTCCFIHLLHSERSLEEKPKTPLSKDINYLKKKIIQTANYRPNTCIAWLLVSGRNSSWPGQEFAAQVLLDNTSATTPINTKTRHFTFTRLRCLFSAALNRIFSYFITKTFHSVFLPTAFVLPASFEWIFYCLSPQRSGTFLASLSTPKGAVATAVGPNLPAQL